MHTSLPYYNNIDRFVHRSLDNGHNGVTDAFVFGILNCPERLHAVLETR